MKQFRFQKRKSERGASLIEYALLIALITLVAIVAIRGVGSGVGEGLTNAADNMGTSGFPGGGEEGPGVPLG